MPYYIHHTPPRDYPNPDNAHAANTPTPNLPALYQARFSSASPSLSLLQFISLSHPFLRPHLRSGWDVRNKSSLQILTATLDPGSAFASWREGLRCTETFSLKNHLGGQKVWVESSGVLFGQKVRQIVKKKIIIIKKAREREERARS